MSSWASVRGIAVGDAFEAGQLLINEEIGNSALIWRVACAYKTPLHGKCWAACVAEPLLAYSRDSELR